MNAFLYQNPMTYLSECLTYRRLGKRGIIISALNDKAVEKEIREYLRVIKPNPGTDQRYIKR